MSTFRPTPAPDDTPTEGPDLVLYRYEPVEPEPDPFVEMWNVDEWQVCTIDGRPGLYAFPVARTTEERTRS